MQKFIRYVILVPVAMVFIPFLSAGVWMSPVKLYSEFFKHLKSGESLGYFD